MVDSFVFDHAEKESLCKNIMQVL